MNKYHGMKLEEIKNKYYIRYDGEDDLSRIKAVNSRLSHLWQDVSYYYSDTKAKLNFKKDELRRLDSQIKYNQEAVKDRLIMENRIASDKSKKWTDKERETKAIVETMTEVIRKTYDNLSDSISELSQEESIWKEIMQNLKFIGQRLDNSSMNIAVEAKMSNKQIGNIDTDYPEEIDIGKQLLKESETENEKQDNDLF